MTQANIFIIDDDQDNQAYLNHVVSKAGHNVKGFLRGKEALTTLQDETPDLIILDVQMPEMNGFQVLKEIRDQNHLSNVPVLMLSAINAVTGDDYDPDVIQERYGVRPDAFINKGGAPDEITEQIEGFLKSPA